MCKNITVSIKCNSTLFYLKYSDLSILIAGYPDHSLTYAFDPMIVYPSNASLTLMRELNLQLSKNPKLYDQVKFLF